MPSIENLPLSLLHSIRGFFSLRELFCSRRVCKSWEDVKNERLSIRCDDLEECPGYVDLPNIISFHHRTFMRRGFQKFQRYCHQSRYTLKVLFIEFKFLYARSILDSYIPFMPNLENLTIKSEEGTVIPIVEAFIKRAPNITHLHIDGFHKVDLNGLHLEHLYLFSDIKVVNANNVKLFFIGNNYDLTNIESIIKTKSEIVFFQNTHEKSGIFKNIVMVIDQSELQLYEFGPNFKETILLIKSLRSQCKLKIKTNTENVFKMAEKLRKLGCFTVPEIIDGLKSV